jgi:pimeloyl-ACP methyl ester carboxylesterase
LELQVAGVSVRAQAAGTGQPLIVLHHSFGNPGWLPLYDDLSSTYRAIVPDLPGFGGSEQPHWARDVRDIALVLGAWIDRLAVGQVAVLGCGFGGWVAAELATMSPARLSHLVLVGAAGVLPREGRIYDQMLVSHSAYIRQAFVDETMVEQLYGEQPDDDTYIAWDLNREMVSRLTWKPYMYNRRLEPMLATVATPALVVWGSDDRIVPRECAERYVSALPAARLEIVDGAGHALDIERPRDVARLVRDFVAAPKES